jgi:hypothetical protein
LSGKSFATLIRRYRFGTRQMLGGHIQVVCELKISEFDSGIFINFQ